jgi:serine/threonine protein kinase
MPIPAKCPRCLEKLEFPSLIRGERGNAWVRCAGCELAVVFDQTGADARGTEHAAYLGHRLSIPGYQLLGVLAVGGMGFLYSAVRTDGDQLCALKVMPPDFMEYRSLVHRFRREVYTMRALRHPNLMPVIETSKEGEVQYLCMPFVPGKTLRHVLDERIQFTLEETAALVPPMGEALDHMHRSGFLHRDVKPSNVLLTARGEVLLFDFGIVRESAGESDLTDEGTVLGTPAYNAPEIFERCETSPQSDQYSLAVIIYQMMTGRLPMGVFARPSVYTPQLPEASEEALLKALQHDPGDRHESVKQFTRAFLRPLINQSGMAESHRWIIRQLAEPGEEMLEVEPSYDAFPEFREKEDGLTWLLKRLTFRR